MQVGFQQSLYDNCLYYRGKLLFAIYVDNGIFASPNADDIDAAIKELQGINCDIEDHGSLSNYLGVNAKHTDQGIYLTQPQLINQIIEGVSISHNALDNLTPAPSTVVLNTDKGGKVFNHNFDYQSIVGKLNFLEKSTSPDIAYTVH